MYYFCHLVIIFFLLFFLETPVYRRDEELFEAELELLKSWKTTPQQNQQDPVSSYLNSLGEILRKVSERDRFELQAIFMNQTIERLPK